ncbi:DNA-binding transcriptional ArsR family regulator [Neisseria perflava]|uniref:ArsR/SmtB family transcription factor n=1 Tax=Neisseria perflava TaxID=33053 RepID=UPI0020A17966|nr:ArsR family transcriptional regulator [Neisseria perflava]MCP1771766.1 DNA-binding transcriptional ArsR family regulator [Neisseria perflava]
MPEHTLSNQRLSTILKMIAKPERMAILFLLLDSDANLDELVAATGQSPTVVSTHLAKLRSEKIISYTRYHRVIEYHLESAETAAILRTLRTLQTQGGQAA